MVEEFVVIIFGGHHLPNKIMERFKKLKLKTFDVPSITLVDIKNLEGNRDVKLPELYEDFLLYYNGGIPTLNTFWFHDEPFIVNNFFFLESSTKPVRDEYLLTEGLLWNSDNYLSIMPKNFLPFARDPGDNIYCLDTHFGKASPVFFWSHDSPDEDLIRLTESFDGFIHHLEEFAVVAD